MWYKRGYCNSFKERKGGSSWQNEILMNGGTKNSIKIHRHSWSTAINGKVEFPIVQWQDVQMEI
jgi:hypothetical protein